jgi:ABC-type branched-subunit amino acid transport system ATPase component
VDVFGNRQEVLRKQLYPPFYKEGARVAITGGDKPNEWLAPQIVNVVLFNLIKELREKEGVTILSAEHNVKFCLGLSDWGYLDKGAVQHNASAQEIQGDDEIKRKH